METDEQQPRWIYGSYEEWDPTAWSTKQRVYFWLWFMAFCPVCLLLLGQEPEGRMVRRHGEKCADCGAGRPNHYMFPRCPHFKDAPKADPPTTITVIGTTLTLPRSEAEALLGKVSGHLEAAQEALRRGPQNDAESAVWRRAWTNAYNGGASMDEADQVADGYLRDLRRTSR